VRLRLNHRRVAPNMIDSGFGGGCAASDSMVCRVSRVGPEVGYGVLAWVEMPPSLAPAQQPMHLLEAQITSAQHSLGS
jgi:hypothetical protein